MKTATSFLDLPWTEEALARLLRYVVIDSTSDRKVETTPTSEGQWELARLLEKELRELGVEDVELTDSCYVIARIPAAAGCEKMESVGLMAHLDTSSDVSGSGVSPQVYQNWDGREIVLKDDLRLNIETYPELKDHIGDTLITSDGTTLLGADNKAGIAIIMTALHQFLLNPFFLHPPLEIIFTPDEETGKGLPDFPLKKIRSRSCYTIDGGGLGEIEDACFNAWKADITFSGSIIHLGQARGKMVNAVTMAANYVGLLPHSESPETTDGWYGYWCPMEIKGSLGQAEVEVFIRDFEDEGIKRRLHALEVFAKTIEEQFPGGKVEVKTEQQYLNMHKRIQEKPEVLNAVLRAADNLGIEPRRMPIRGGTDGSRLTELGIPCPNIFTGGHNFHSLSEWASLGTISASIALVIELMKERSLGERKQ